MISHSNRSNESRAGNSHNGISSSLPLWTWVAPLLIANIGTWLSLWFITGPGTSLWYLPTALGIVMVYWWGPRALLGVYLNAVLCTPLWDLPWKWSPLYALPETIEVGLSWLLFLKLMRWRPWLPNLVNVVQFLLFGSLIPAALANLYLVAQLIWLGDIARSTLWNNWIILFSADVATHFVLAVPALILFTKSMAERGWAKMEGTPTRLPFLPENRNSKADISFIGLVFVIVFIMVFTVSIRDYWIVYGLLMITLAIRYGMNIAVVASSWTGTLAFLLPPIIKNGLRLPTTDDFIINFQILFLCAISLIIGRAISDLFIEISERKQAETALRENEEKYRTLFETANDAIVLFNRSDNKIIDANQTTCTMYGYTLDELRQLSVTDLSAEAHATVDAIRSGVIRVPLRYHKKKDGTVFPVEISAASFPLAGISVQVGFIRDITERSKAEEVLQQANARLEILHEIDRSLLAAHDIRELAMNALVRIRQLIPCPRASVSLFNHEKKEARFLTADFEGMVEIPDTPITFEKFGQRVIDELLKNKPWFSDDVLIDPQVTELDKQLVEEAGIHAWLCLPLMTQGQLIGALNLGRHAGSSFNKEDAIIAHDVANQLAIALQQSNLNAALQNELTERKKLITELEQRNDELTRFTYTVSHDLRNPLVTIKGFLGMLDKDIREKRQDKIQIDFQRIAGAADKMDALLTDLLELSRVGRIVNPPVEVDTVRLIQDAIDSVDARIRSRNAVVNFATDLPILYGDRTRLREVFENLIDNAIKYMGNQIAPTIDIGVRNKQDEPIFFVKDNGMGIEAKYHTKIFGLFEKLDTVIEGTGIGLALVKRIIETHGGKIWVESDGLGKGSTFCFTIPIKQQTPQPG